jgi:hypothetical protein
MKMMSITVLEEDQKDCNFPADIEELDYEDDFKFDSPEKAPTKAIMPPPSAPPPKAKKYTSAVQPAAKRRGIRDISDSSEEEADPMPPASPIVKKVSKKKAPVVKEESSGVESGDQSVCGCESGSNSGDSSSGEYRSGSDSGPDCSDDSDDRYHSEDDSSASSRDEEPNTDDKEFIDDDSQTNNSDTEYQPTEGVTSTVQEATTDGGGATSTTETPVTSEKKQKKSPKVRQRTSRAKSKKVYYAEADSADCSSDNSRYTDNDDIEHIEEQYDQETSESALCTLSLVPVLTSTSKLCIRHTLAPIVVSDTSGTDADTEESGGIASKSDKEDTGSVTKKHKLIKRQRKSSVSSGDDDDDVSPMKKAKRENAPPSVSEPEGIVCKDEKAEPFSEASTNDSEIVSVSQSKESIKADTVRSLATSPLLDTLLIDMDWYTADPSSAAAAAKTHKPAKSPTTNGKGKKRKYQADEVDTATAADTVAKGAGKDKPVVETKSKPTKTSKKTPPPPVSETSSESGSASGSSSGSSSDSESEEEKKPEEKQNGEKKPEEKKAVVTPLVTKSTIVETPQVENTTTPAKAKAYKTKLVKEKAKIQPVKKKDSSGEDTKKKPKDAPKKRKHSEEDDKVLPDLSSDNPKPPAKKRSRVTKKAVKPEVSEAKFATEKSPEAIMYTSTTSKPTTPTKHKAAKQAATSDDEEESGNGNVYMTILDAVNNKKSGNLATFMVQLQNENDAKAWERFIRYVKESDTINVYQYQHCTPSNGKHKLKAVEEPDVDDDVNGLAIIRTFPTVSSFTPNWFKEVYDRLEKHSIKSAVFLVSPPTMTMSFTSVRKGAIVKTTTNISTGSTGLLADMNAFIKNAVTDNVGLNILDDLVKRVTHLERAANK